MRNMEDKLAAIRPPDDLDWSSSPPGREVMLEAIRRGSLSKSDPHRYRRRAWMGSGVALAVLSIGTGYAVAQGQFGLTGPTAEESHPYPANSSGLTFGELPHSQKADEPDLVLVVGVGGVKGYAKRDDLFADNEAPSSPAEAVRQQKERDRAATDEPLMRSIPIYKSDGKTKVGTFLVTVATGRH